MSSIEHPNRPVQDQLQVPKPHLAHFDGRTYNVRKLELAAQLLPEKIFDLSAETVESIILNKYWEDTRGAFLGPSDLISAFRENDQDWDRVLERYPTWSEHIAKIQRVNYASPILVHKGHIIDGMHRFTKALCENARSIPYKELDELPAEAIYGE